MKSEKVLLTLRIRKRHVLIFVLLIAGGLVAYSNYYREFMTLPQSAAVLLKETSIDLSNKKILVLAPHCDDEILGQAGVMKRATSMGSEVKVIMVTDCNKHKIGKVREQETLSALSLVGVESGVQFWDFAEGRDHTQEETGDLLTKLNDTITTFQPNYIFVPHPRDTHVDHRWVGKTFQQVDISLRPRASTFYYLIHYNFLKYPSPAGLEPESFLTPPIKLIVPHNTWEKFTLSSEEEDIKEEAILKYKSQLKVTNPVLNRVLLDFVRRNELFMVEND